jgi:hypothetical protein
LKRKITIVSAAVVFFALCFFLLKIPVVSTSVFRHAVIFKTRFCMKNKVVAGWSGWLFFEPELSYCVNPLPLDNMRKIREYDSTLSAHGMTLFVVPVPNKIDIYPEKFTLFPSPVPVKKERAGLLRKLDSIGVRVIDLVPAFVNLKKDGLVFDPYESHWSALGIETAARIIAGRIDSAFVNKGLLHDTRYTVCDTILKTRGDLHERLDSSGASLWYPFGLRRVKCVDDSFYSDDRKSGILIIGDSFVNHGKWWNAGLGAQIARFLRHPTRTYFSLLANTEGPCMYKIKPAVFPKNGIVIWTFTSRVLQYQLGDPAESDKK